jgi:Fis family transcriptional regulator, factor for inversion stimulation protein
MRAQLEALIDEMLDGNILLAEAVNEFEWLYIKKALSRNKQHLSKTAKALGIHRNTISKHVANANSVKRPLARAARSGSR